jgi:hypothetical protein
LKLALLILKMLPKDAAVHMDDAAVHMDNAAVHMDNAARIDASMPQI